MSSRTHTQTLLAHLFPPADRPRVLAELDRLPPDCRDCDRIIIACLKISDGDPAHLTEAVDLATVDWRDLLLAAGFAHDPDAHLHWRPDPK